MYQLCLFRCISVDTYNKMYQCCIDTNTLTSRCHVPHVRAAYPCTASRRNNSPMYQMQFAHPRMYQFMYQSMYQSIVSLGPCNRRPRAKHRGHQGHTPSPPGHALEHPSQMPPPEGPAPTAKVPSSFFYVCLKRIPPVRISPPTLWPLLPTRLSTASRSQFAPKFTRLPLTIVSILRLIKNQSSGQNWAERHAPRQIFMRRRWTGPIAPTTIREPSPTKKGSPWPSNT